MPVASQMYRLRLAKGVDRSIKYAMSPSAERLGFLGLCLLSLALWWRALLATIALALQSDEYTHILLILPISVALVCVDWRLRKAQLKPSVWIGCTLMAIALVIGFGASSWWGASRPADERLSLSMLALVTWWIGSFVCCVGVAISRMYAFPLCFLLWLVPPPAAALNHIVGFLQQGSAYAARVFFTIARVPVAQDGVRLTIPGLMIEVAKECSSIRSSLILLVTTMVLAQLLLRSPWGKGLVILAAIPLSIAKNGLRIFVLSMLGVYVDPGFLDGWLHHHGGIVFFLVFLAALFALLRLVKYAEHNPALQAAVPTLPRPVAVSKANT
jgi:exosortase